MKLSVNITDFDDDQCKKLRVDADGNGSNVGAAAKIFQSPG